MSKSKNVFFILGIVYLAVALGSVCPNFIVINDNVLLGLSASSCLISFGELLNNSGSFFICRNSFRYSLHFTSDYLDSCIKDGKKARTDVDVYNIKLNVDETLSNKKSIHPVIYAKNRVFKYLKAIQQLSFVCGISFFILMPFANINLSTQVATRTITITAFAFVCLNIAVSDRIQEVVSAQARFESDKVLIIEDAFSGFTSEYYYHLQHHVLYSKRQEAIIEDSKT